MKRFTSFLKSSIGMLVFALTLSSCYTTKVGLHEEVFTINDYPEFRKQCIGQTYNQIVTKLGAPQRQSSDGNGGTILIYENTTTTSISNSVATAYNVNYYTRTYTPGVTTAVQQTSSTDYVQYFVNSNNVCYEVKTNLDMTHLERRTVNGPYRKFNAGKTLLWWCVVPGVIIGALGALSSSE